MSKRILRGQLKELLDEKSLAQREVSSSSHENYNPLFLDGKRVSSVFDG